MNPSFLPKITDYFDYGAIDHWASLLHKMSSEALSNCVGDLGDAVTEHTRVLSDELLQRVAFVIADDLYKTANTINLWSDSVETYLRATAGVFFDLLDQRGFRLHYVIDNSFEDMERPLRFFPTWYSACGIAYECPQLLTAQDGTHHLPKLAVVVLPLCMPREATFITRSLTQIVRMTLSLRRVSSSSRIR